MPNAIITNALKTIDLEAQAIRELAGSINTDFERAVQLIHDSRGRVIISGIGKSALIAQKIVATLNSTGTPAAFLHAADAIHGDIGMVQQEDLVIIISKSGESPEIKILVPLIKNFHNTLIAICGNMDSYLSKSADLVLNTTVSEEACPNNLAPTTSTTAQLVMGDALAICLMNLKGFGTEDFAKFHPGGTLGKKLYLQVGDLISQNQKPVVHEQSTLKDVIIEMTNKRLGAAVVLNDREGLAGIITDGDLRRMLERNLSPGTVKAGDIMTRNPKTIESGRLAIDALDLLRKNNITQLVVTKQQEYAGIIHLHDLIREGII
ncbi:MAG: KpsF/GutQ family sugar-phosphate isomerase [Bacteroidota bacterium]|nr:KpsF/GutQ family sugar-phosphate isomerase [Bacteroidota bacterium]